MVKEYIWEIMKVIREGVPISGVAFMRGSSIDYAATTCIGNVLHSAKASLTRCKVDS